MKNQTIEIVTFNRNEADAVHSLLLSLADGAGSWRVINTVDEDAVVRDPRGNVIKLIRLGAQGNVNAARGVMKFYRSHEAVDSVIFYGCCGTPEEADLRKAFLVRYVNYMALGSVKIYSHDPKSEPPNGVQYKSPQGDALSDLPELEVVTLSNKWFADTEDYDGPLEFEGFEFVRDSWPFDICRATAIPPADVISTENVIKRLPATKYPRHKLPSPPRRFDVGRWTYGEALAYFMDDRNHPLLIDMESYGILTSAKALSLSKKVLVLRITTDRLENHEQSPQREILFQGLVALGRVLVAVLNAGDFDLKKVGGEVDGKLDAMAVQTPLLSLVQRLQYEVDQFKKPPTLMLDYFERHGQMQIEILGSLISSPVLIVSNDDPEVTTSERIFRRSDPRNVARRYFRQILADAKTMGLGEEPLTFNTEFDLTGFQDNLLRNLLSLLVLTSETPARQRQELATGFLTSSRGIDQWEDLGPVLGPMTSGLLHGEREATAPLDFTERVRELAEQSRVDTSSIADWTFRFLKEGSQRISELLGLL